MSTSEKDDGKVRLDKWLWAARFFKTRSLAQTAVGGGKVRLNDDRVKVAKEVKVGDTLTIDPHDPAFQGLAQGQQATITVA